MLQELSDRLSANFCLAFFFTPCRTRASCAAILTLWCGARYASVSGGSPSYSSSCSCGCAVESDVQRSLHLQHYKHTPQLGRSLRQTRVEVSLTLLCIVVGPETAAKCGVSLPPWGPCHAHEACLVFLRLLGVLLGTFGVVSQSTLCCF